MEIVATADGGRSFGHVALTHGREFVRGVMLQSATEGQYVGEWQDGLTAHHGLPHDHGAGAASFIAAPRLDATFARLLCANGLIAVAEIRGAGFELTQAFPENRMLAAPQFVSLGSIAVAAWDADTIVAASGYDLLTVRLSFGRWQRFANWIAMPVPGASGVAARPERPASEVVGLGRAGNLLAIVLADGTVLAYR
jgi:hypothetical protein